VRLFLDLNWIAAVLLAALRVGMALVLTPVLAFGNVPTNVRVLFLLALSALLVSGLATPAPVIDLGIGALAGAALREALLGALLAFGLFAGFAAFQLAGGILDLQLGLGIAALIDPTTRAQTPLLGTLLFMAAVMAFFAIDGHHMVVRGLAYSLERIPPGTAASRIEPGAIVAHFGAMFSFAVAIAAPVIVILLLVDTALAIMARTMPQMNVFFAGLPLKILVGLMALALSVQYMAPVALRVYESIFDFWQRVLE
jgi:flagellar biosynthetic protein FliR